MRERLLELLRTLRQRLGLDDAVARLAGDEAGVLEERTVEAEQGRRPLDPELGEGAQHASDRAVAIDVVDDQLRDHRVVEPAHLVARLDPGVDAHARPGRLAVRGDPARRGQEAARDVLRVDPAFERVPADHDVVLRDRERLARGDEDLLADKVDPGDELGHGVLDLDPRVHLHEEVLAVPGQEPLDRPGRAVSRRACGVDRDAADPRAERVVDRRRGRLLDELLVASLDRAVPLAEVDHVPVPVREHLDLDVARILDEPLDVDGRVGEVLLPLPRRGVERTLGFAGLADDLHALAAAARGGLDDERVPDLVAERDHRRGDCRQGRRRRG